MNNLILAEWYKLRKNMPYRVLCLVTLSIGILYELFQLRSDASNVSSMSLFVKALGGNEILTKLAICVLAAFFISSEYANGTMKSTASIGCSRGRIYTAKVIVFTLGAALLCLIFPLTDVALGSLLYGFGHLAQVSAVEYLYRTLGFTVLFAAAFSTIAALIAVSLTDNGKTIGVSIILFLFIDPLSKKLGAEFPWYQHLYNN
ncbi:MAG: ABC transporter permease, partial [Alicyclobacillus shizuokensis]|nr:ABC transporter permease [Alicyclobacillus shizuokensis]